MSATPVGVWLNRGLEAGNHSRAGLAPPFSIPAPSLNAFAAYREADVNGNGSRDILWNTRRRQLGFVDFSPGVQPNLLSSIDNGIGGRTRIRYSSSVSEMVGDAAVGRPWSQTAPFPVPVVSGIVVDDGLNRYRTEYAYRDGYYDSAEKEFRGFAEVTQTDLGDETIPDLVTAYLFDTGSGVKALKGKAAVSAETRSRRERVLPGTARLGHEDVRGREFGPRSAQGDVPVPVGKAPLISTKAARRPYPRHGISSTTTSATRPASSSTAGWIRDGRTSASPRQPTRRRIPTGRTRGFWIGSWSARR